MTEWLYKCQECGEVIPESDIEEFRWDEYGNPETGYSESKRGVCPHCGNEYCYLYEEVEDD